MPVQVARACRIALSAAALLLAVTACDEAQLPGGSATAAPANPFTSRALPTPGASAAPPGSASGSSSRSGSDGRVSAVFEVNGSGKVSSLHVDDGTPQGLDLYNVPLPFRKEARVDPGADLLQVHGAGALGPVSCRITLGGDVVAESDDTGDCVYSRTQQK